MRAAVVVLAALALAGCWESEGSLYGAATPVEPFRPGKMVSYAADKPAEVSRAVLSKGASGVYRLTNADKGKDFGDAIVLRFFTGPGLPKDVFVFEAVSDDKCRPGESCRPITAKSERDYGLVRLTKTGAEVTSPDCDKASPAAKLPGVSLRDYGICRFASRAALEAAGRDQAGRPWKPHMVYRYE
jgi:hypothetical protein